MLSDPLQHLLEGLQALSGFGLPEGSGFVVDLDPIQV